MQRAEAARDWLCTPEAQVSAHYVLCRTGRLWQLVREEDRAWHAGAGSWAGTTDINSRSIGIELANTGSEPFSEPQMARLETLLQQIMKRWDIPPQNVLGHSDTAMGRKIDPGLHFDWKRLARRGLAIWPDMPAAVPEARFEELATRFGYDMPQGGCETLLAAFRMRFRPWATGPLTAEDAAIMSSLAQFWPARRQA